MADQGTEGVLSAFLRRQRFDAARPYLRGRVLDVGAGTGGLADFVSAENYVGIEIDQDSLKMARASHPDHQFERTLPEKSGGAYPFGEFDTIVLLAVIEHLKDPEDFLHELARHLKRDPGNAIVLTTPHPSVDWVHRLGSRAGLFSRHASDEHENLLNRKKLEEIGHNVGLKLIVYKRFLLGANQLAVFEHESL